MAQSVNQLGNTTAAECGTSPGNTGGCTVVSSTDASYGTGFAAAGGGVYVAEFAEDGIRVWFFSVRHPPRPPKELLSNLHPISLSSC